MKDSVNNYAKCLFYVAIENNQINEVLYDYVAVCDNLNYDSVRFFNNKINS